MSLVTIEDFAGYLKRGLSDVDRYTADLMLNGATAAVVEYCGWHIAPVLSEIVTVDGTGTTVQTLPTLNLLGLDALTENGQLLDVDRIDWSANGLLEKRSGGGWTNRRRGIQAMMTHGYETTPAWLTAMICSVAGRAFVTPVGIAEESAGGESVSYAVGRSGAIPPGAVMLLPFEKKMLDRIRVPLAA